MKTTPEEIELFDHYLRGEIDNSERLILENKIKADPELKAKFDDFLALEKALEDNEIIQFKSNLTNWDKTKKEQKGTKIFSLKFFALAASIVILIGIGATFLLMTPSNASLISANFDPYDNVLTIRGEKEDIDDGLKLYEQKEYSEAIIQFEKYPENENALFYLAESEMALNNYSEAVLAYEKVITLNNIFQEVATYHLSLAQLGAEEKEKAVKTLNSIPKSSDYYQKAQALLEDLK